MKVANKNAKKCTKNLKKVKIICIYAKFFVTLRTEFCFVHELNELNESKCQEYETSILTIDCRSSKCVLCNGGSAEYCN